MILCHTALAIWHPDAIYLEVTSSHLFGVGFGEQGVLRVYGCIQRAPSPPSSPPPLLPGKKFWWRARYSCCTSSHHPPLQTAHAIFVWLIIHGCEDFQGKMQPRCKNSYPGAEYSRAFDRMLLAENLPFPRPPLVPSSLVLIAARMNDIGYRFDFWWVFEPVITSRRPRNLGDQSPRTLSRYHTSTRNDWSLCHGLGWKRSCAKNTCTHTQPKQKDRERRLRFSYFGTFYLGVSSHRETEGETERDREK